MVNYGINDPVVFALFGVSVVIVGAVLSVLAVLAFGAGAGVLNRHHR